MPVSAADLSLKRSATGLGLFALRDITARRRIVEYLGELITDEEADRRRGKYLFDLGGGLCIDGRSRANPTRYVNHSCLPNAAWVRGAPCYSSSVWSLSIDLIKTESEGHERLSGHIGRTRGIFDRLNSDVDFLAWELRPAALDQLGLDAALETFVREWSAHFRIEATYRGLGTEGPRLSPEVETNLYRILQEALQNVHKHAGATHVSVLLERHDGRVALIVEDNGCGYDPEEEVAADSNKGMGVVNMRERTALVGGTFEIESSPGTGTTVFVRVPLKAEPPAPPGEEGPRP